MAKRDRYKEFEQLMTVSLLGCVALFVLYLIVAAAGIAWLKVILAIVDILIPLGGLALLWMSKELLRPRSLWISCGFFSVIACTLASLILAFP